MRASRYHVTGGISIRRRRAEAMDDLRRILGDLAADGTMTALWCAAKATAVMAGAGLGALAMSRKAAAARHLVWALGLAGAVAVMPLAIALPRWSVPVLEPPAGSEPVTAPKVEPITIPSEGPVVAATPMRPIQAPDFAAIQTSRLATENAVPPRVNWPLAAWAAGSLAVLAWG